MTIRIKRIKNKTDLIDALRMINEDMSLGYFGLSDYTLMDFSRTIDKIERELNKGDD